jgi:hypothetical protein
MKKVKQKKATKQTKLLARVLIGYTQKVGKKREPKETAGMVNE